MVLIRTVTTCKESLNNHLFLECILPNICVCYVLLCLMEYWDVDQHANSIEISSESNLLYVSHEEHYWYGTYQYPF